LYDFGSTGFLIFACLGSISKAIVGVSGAATRACITQHQAKKDNLAGF
jgi:hypothetical protein